MTCPQAAPYTLAFSYSLEPAYRPQPGKKREVPRMVMALALKPGHYQSLGTFFSYILFLVHALGGYL